PPAACCAMLTSATTPIAPSGARRRQATEPAATSAAAMVTPRWSNERAAISAAAAADNTIASRLSAAGGLRVRARSAAARRRIIQANVPRAQPRRIGLGDDRNRTSGPLFPGRTGPEFDPESGYRPMTTHGSGFRFARSATKETCNETPRPLATHADVNRLVT